jgi:hypothetical protein
MPREVIEHNAATGEEIVRELTAEEIAALPELTEPLGDDK